MCPQNLQPHTAQNPQPQYLQHPQPQTLQHPQLQSSQHAEKKNFQHPQSQNNQKSFDVPDRYAEEIRLQREWEEKIERLNEKYNHDCFSTSE